jgi:hypothetical protein
MKPKGGTPDPFPRVAGVPSARRKSVRALIGCVAPTGALAGCFSILRICVWLGKRSEAEPRPGWLVRALRRRGRAPRCPPNSRGTLSSDGSQSAFRGGALTGLDADYRRRFPGRGPPQSHVAAPHTPPFPSVPLLRYYRSRSPRPRKGAPGGDSFATARRSFAIPFRQAGRFLAVVPGESTAAAGGPCFSWISCGFSDCPTGGDFLDSESWQPSGAPGARGSHDPFAFHVRG